jgi:hypothetical protein
MANLSFLDVSESPLTGTLPPEFGSAGKMPINAAFYLGLTKLQGPIPLSWSYFSLGLVEVGGSNIDLKCIPDGLFVLSDYMPVEADPCSGTNPQITALLTLRRMINTAGGTSDGLATWDGTDRGGAGEHGAPRITTNVFEL